MTFRLMSKIFCIEAPFIGFKKPRYPIDTQVHYITVDFHMTVVYIPTESERTPGDIDQLLCMRLILRLLPGRRIITK